MLDDDIVVNLHPIGGRRIARRPKTVGFWYRVRLHGICVVWSSVREDEPAVGISPAENLRVRRGGEANEDCGCREQNAYLATIQQVATRADWRGTHQ